MSGSGPLAVNAIKLPESDKVVGIVQSKSNTSRYWIATTYTGVFELVLQNENVTSLNPVGPENLLVDQVQSILEDQSGNLWVATLHGLVSLKNGEAKENYQKYIRYNSSNGFEEYVKTVFEDREGNIWAGLYGQGLARLDDEFISFFYNSENEAANNIQSIFIEKNTKWFGSGNGLLSVTTNASGISYKEYKNEFRTKR